MYGTITVGVTTVVPCILALVLIWNKFEGVALSEPLIIKGGEPVSISIDSVVVFPWETISGLAVKVFTTGSGLMVKVTVVDELAHGGIPLTS